MKRLKFVISLLLLLSINIQFIHCQKKYEILKLMQDTTLFHAHTNDRIYWNGRCYNCNKSPLSTFVNYKSIYPACPKSGVEEGFLLDNEWDDKNYKVSWALNDNMLYLCDVEPFCLSGDSLENRHVQIENLTGLKFKKAINIKDSKIRINKQGFIMASWFTGVIYIKEYKNYEALGAELKTQDDIIKYLKEPFIKLEFKNGLLLKSNKKMCKIKDET